MPQTSATAILQGGMNLVTAALAVPAGQIIAGNNYFPVVSGLRRADGYERYDGRPRPSLASYWVLNFDAGTAAISLGDQVDGATSGATGKALVDAVVESGSYGGSDAAGYLVLTDVSGTFQDNENLQVSAATKCVANGVAAESGALTDANNSTWSQAAEATRRALITTVPGSGPVRGVKVLNGDLYAVRDNAGATAGILHKATSSGWTAQDLGSILQFDAATAEFLEGETVTGGTSTHTATIRRVVLETGSWSSGTGFLVVSGASGTFQDNETITSASGSATSNGIVTANALPAGGRYDFTVHNFFGAAYTERLYGCQGEGYAFEWDGTYFTPIRTGLSASLDKPIRIAHFANHLFLAYQAGTINFSEIGVPTQFKTTAGAGSFEFGSPITDFPEEESTALVIFGRSQIGYIVGSSSSDFDLQDVSNDSGAIAWTVQTAGSPTYLDDAGVRRMETTEAFGNWRLGTLTQLIEPLFKSKRDAGVCACASIRVRARDQYRLFFDDKSGIAVYLGREFAEVTSFELGHTVECTCVGYVNGEEQESLFVGTSDGYVMELDRGKSFDGSQVLSWIRLPFNNLGTPRQNKRFSKAILECDAPAGASLKIITEFDNANPDQPPTGEQAFDVNSGGGFWNQDNWNQFYWSAQAVGEAEADIDGYGRNVSIGILSEATHEEPHTLSALTINYAPRGMKR